LNATALTVLIVNTNQSTADLRMLSFWGKQQFIIYGTSDVLMLRTFLFIYLLIRGLIQVMIAQHNTN